MVEPLVEPLVDDDKPTWRDRIAAVLRIGAMVALVVYLLGQFLGNTAPMTPGSKAPELALRSYDGQEWHLDRFSGAPLVVNFWGSWCPPCVSELPDLVKTAKAYDGDIVFIGAAVTSPANDVVTLIRKFEIPYPIAATNQASTKRWHANRYPSTYVFDADHKLVWSTQGMVSQSMLAQVFEEHLGIAKK